MLPEGQGVGFRRFSGAPEDSKTKNFISPRRETEVTLESEVRPGSQSGNVRLASTSGRLYLQRSPDPEGPGSFTTRRRIFLYGS